MATFDRRRYLMAVAGGTSIATIPPAIGSKGQRPDDEIGVDPGIDVDPWEYVRTDPEESAFEDVLGTEDGYVLVGGGRAANEFETQGIATELAADGDTRWEESYRSQPQQETREMEPAVGPTPEDWLTLALETEDGYLLVGWTYFDGPAVYVTRLYLVDEAGNVQQERSLGELEDASAYSYLTDGLETGEGYLCCGTESPGIMLGSAGWLVRLDETGTVIEYTRYPATERDLETTTRSDVFRSIAPTENGYVVVGSYEPEPGEPAEAWMLGLDEDGDVRWDERFALADEEPTVVYAVEPSDVENYAFLAVGTTGEWPRVARRSLSDPELDGDGFVAAYTDDGEQQWLERVPNQPLYCAERTDAGVVAGGARDGVGWVGTLEGTDFEADVPSVVTSLSDGQGGLLAAGKRLEEPTSAWAQLVAASRAGDDV